MVRCTARLIAAATSPEAPRTGTAIERRPYASSSSLTAIPVARTRSRSLSRAGRSGARVRAEPAELHAVDGRVPLLVGQEGQHRLAQRGAVGGQARADVQVEIDLPLAAPRAAAALDVDDVGAVQDRHVHGVARFVAQPLQVWRRDLAQLHRVDRGEAEVDDARAEPVLLGQRVLLEVAESGESRDVTMRCAPVQSHLAGQLADPEQRLDGCE